MHAKKIIDISWPVSPTMTTYKDRRDVTITPVATWDPDHYRLTAIAMNAHTGTHVDAPSHFLEDGITLEKMPMANFIGACTVFDLSHCTEKITQADLQGLAIAADSIVVFKTKNSQLADDALFDFNFVYLAADAVQLLVDKQIKALAFDYIGIERAQGAHDSHKNLMRNNIAIIEGVRLGHVEAGDYTLLCLPINLLGADGAPARVVLLQD
jgi:arylformamidase